ncbi:MAG: hypothetical protein L0J62_10460 [Corynebacterium casei]|uniref:hypothetical protein n=1 Tax=Corynebacterium casei TaxID=160386 RepID=UPI0026486FFE|nr:hypothetical protein [Corynebacterium casei]MDN6286096.1 hypothetical protein [Corynebacterium casei]
MSNFELRILDLDDNVVEVMEFDTFRQAERAERGVRINLDHANYHTDIVRK